MRLTAVFYLGRYQDPHVTDVLLHALWTEDDKPNEDDRHDVELNMGGRRIIEALKTRHEPQILDELIRLLLSDRPMRQYAASGLGDLADPRAVEPLCQALEMPHHSFDYILWALEKIGDPRAIAALEAFGKSGEGSKSRESMWTRERALKIAANLWLKETGLS